MNVSTSDYSSGCESGWTTYLDNQYSNSDPYYTRGFYEQKCMNDDDGEDLSMVSDASSAPPHSAYYSSYAAPEETKKKSKSKSKSRKEPKEQNLCLDDTASSSLFHFSQDNVPPSHHHDSLGHFQGESVTKKRLSFFKSSTKGKSSGNVVGRKRQ